MRNGGYNKSDWLILLLCLVSQLGCLLDLAVKKIDSFLRHIIGVFVFFSVVKHEKGAIGIKVKISPKHDIAIDLISDDSGRIATGLDRSRGFGNVPDRVLNGCFFVQAGRERVIVINVIYLGAFLKDPLQQLQWYTGQWRWKFSGWCRIGLGGGGLPIVLGGV